MLFYKDAIKIARNNKNSKMKGAIKRLKPYTFPKVEPKFKFGAGERIFTIGSCFARNIEEHLSRLGFEVPMLDFKVPQREWMGERSNGILNKYTPASIYQEIQWVKSLLGSDGVVDISSIEKYVCQVGDNFYVDTQLSSYEPVTKERLVERRQQIFDVARNMFSCDVVIITLGLIESWYDNEKEVYIQKMPNRDMLSDEERFSFKLIEYDESYELVEKAIRMFDSDKKVLITTSPVPLARTFSEDDVIVANMYSKSILRAVCGSLVKKYNNVDYFPSYETVVLTKDWNVFQPDLIHVSDSYVGQIMKKVTETYCEDFSAEDDQYFNLLDKFNRGEYENIVDDYKDSNQIFDDMKSALLLFESLYKINKYDDLINITEKHKLEKNSQYHFLRAKSYVAQSDYKNSLKEYYSAYEAEFNLNFLDLYVKTFTNRCDDLDFEICFYSICKHEINKNFVFKFKNIVKNNADYFSNLEIDHVKYFQIASEYYSKYRDDSVFEILLTIYRNGKVEIDRNIIRNDIINIVPEYNIQYFN